MKRVDMWIKRLGEIENDITRVQKCIDKKGFAFKNEQRTIYSLVKERVHILNMLKKYAPDLI